MTVRKLLSPRITTIAHVSFYAGLVDNLVDLVGRHARLRGRCGDVEYLTRQPAHLPHALLCLCIQNLDPVAAHQRPAGLGNAVGRIVRVGYGLRHNAPLGQRVDGPQGSREVEVRKWVEVRRCCTR